MMTVLLLMLVLQIPDCPCAQPNVHRAVEDINSINKSLDDIEKHVQENSIRLAKYDERTRVVAIVLGLLVTASAAFQVVHRSKSDKPK
jgi:hypothetical protein